MLPHTKNGPKYTQVPRTHSLVKRARGSCSILPASYHRGLRDTTLPKVQVGLGPGMVGATGQAEKQVHLSRIKLMQLYLCI